MPFYFFTDTANLITQGSNGAFGPALDTTIGGINYQQYLVTSLHTASTHNKAFAVCKGQLYFQEQASNPDLLNIILKPLDSVPFNFPVVKFFLYKGIRKDSVISSDGLSLASRGTSDLIDSIWNAFQITNSGGSPEKSIIGLDTAINVLPDTTLIETVFSSSFDHVQFWTVNAGESLGEFDQSNIGFEIVLDSAMYMPTLKIARSASTFIQCIALSSSFSQKDFFKHWHSKEDVLSFIDPCAFFGCFYADTLNVINGSQTLQLKKEQIYNDLLTKFNNKNLCYIDIRNEFNNSINFFKNYGASATDNTTAIKIKKGNSASFNTFNYYENGWPIFSFDGSEFSSNSSDHQVVSIQLPTGTGDNPAPLVFFTKAYVSGLDFPSDFTKQQVFNPLEVASNYTGAFSIGLPWYNNVLVSNYALVKYCKRTSNTPLPAAIPTQIRKTDPLDGLFTTAMNIPTGSAFSTKVYNEGVYIDQKSTDELEATYNISVTTDDNFTLTAVPAVINSAQANRAPLAITNEPNFVIDSVSNYQNLALNTEGSDILRMQLTISGDEFDVLHTRPSYNDLAEKIHIPDLRKLLGFALTQQEWASLLQTAQANFLPEFPVYIIVYDKQYLEDDNEVDYTQVTLGLCGYTETGNTIQVQKVGTNLKIYSYGTI